MAVLKAIARTMGRLTDRLPMSIGSRLKRGRFRYDPADVPPALTVPPVPIRVLIAPANSAGQAWNFARALDRLDGVAARNFHIVGERDYGFPADGRIDGELSSISAPWQRRQLATARRFSHVIVESGRPQFGRLFDGDTRREIEAMQAAGVSVAVLAHGSDLRDPDRHRGIDEWSPYGDDSWEFLPSLAQGSARFRALLESVSLPVFVTTPDLLADWPSARWAPLVIDAERWRTEAPLLARSRPVVAHAPTNRHIKGTDLIEPVLSRLHDEGIIEYRRHEGIQSADMPAHFADADIIVEQMRLGAYGSVAIEAMAAGRLVIAHLHDQTLDAVRRVTSSTCPIVRATPRTLEDTIRWALDCRDAAREAAAPGPEFARRVHGGAMTAEVISRSFLQET